jgi:hypothetical protein
MLYAMFAKGFLPIRIRGNLTTMPAEFLVDETGAIHTAHYGKDPGDHLPFEQVKAFALAPANECRGGAPVSGNNQCSTPE